MLTESSFRRQIDRATLPPRVISGRPIDSDDREGDGQELGRNWAGKFGSEWASRVDSPERTVGDGPPDRDVRV